MLELKDISYKTEDGKYILKGINLTIDERFVAITGPNGSGKSTLAKIITGILKQTEGQIILDGVDISDMSITDRARLGVTFAFQQPVRFKGLTVHDLLCLAAGDKLSVSKACDYLAEVGLCAREYVNREINASLSGGELKRIEIAMANVRGTKLTICDEPEAGIDLWSFNSLIKVFENMYDRTQGSIVIISHQERILDIADKIIVLKAGEIDTIGTKEEILPSILSSSASCHKLEGGKN